VLVSEPPADPKKAPFVGDDPLVKAIVKASGKGGILRFDAARGAAFARAEAERLRVPLDSESLRGLCELVGDRPDQITRELDKIATWSGGGAVTAEDVRVLVAGRADDAPWSLLDAITERRRTAALEELVRLLQGGAEPHRLLPQIARHLVYVRETVEAAEAGPPTREALARRLGIAPFRAGKMLTAIGTWTPLQTGAALAAMRRTDAAMKGFSRLPPAFALERGLAAALKGA